MIDGLKPYPRMKDSGVPWVGQVPEYWAMTRLGYSASLVVPMRDKPEDLSGEIPWIRIEDFSGRYIDSSRSGQGVSPTTVRKMNLKVFPAGTVLCSCSCSMGATAIARRPLVSNQTFIGIVPGPSLTSEYVYWLMQVSKEHLTQLATGAIQQYLSRQDFGALVIIVPSLSEQAAIVRFLDHADRRIRRYIRAKQKLVKLLEEQKQAIIHRAVTRGLDPNVRLKPSDVEWLGDVPEHWEVRRVKQVAQVLRGKFTHRPRNDPSLYDGPYPFIQTGEVARAEKSITNYRQTLNDRGLAVSKMFPSGTLVMTIAANIGDVAVLDFEACFPDSVVGFVPRAGVERDFLYYVFRAMKCELLREAPVNTQGNLNVDRIGSRGIALAPVLEQRAIVLSIEAGTARLTAGTSHARREIDLLREVRTRLIADVVTGKLDVRKAAAKLPEEADEPEPPEEVEEPTEDGTDGSVGEGSDEE